MNSKPGIWLVAGLTVCLVVVLSVIPGDLQIRTGAPKFLEHFVAYLGAGAVLAYAFGPNRRAQLVVIFLIVLAGCLEAVQHWVPGRTPSLADWQAGGLGALVGAIVAQLWSRARTRHRDARTATTYPSRSSTIDDPVTGRTPHYLESPGLGLLKTIGKGTRHSEALRSTADGKSAARRLR